MTSLDYPVFIGVSSRQQLDFLAHALGLSETELGTLFGVTRQAVSAWRERGVPARRTASVDRIVEFTQFLQRRLVPGRIPQIIRTKAKGLDRHSMLEVLRESGPDRLYEYMTRLAAYANT
ncbi:MAG: hypothetical protein ABI231_00825 [Candidatus Tumulicola sp.]